MTSSGDSIKQPDELDIMTLKRINKFALLEKKNATNNCLNKKFVILNSSSMKKQAKIFVFGVLFGFSFVFALVYLYFVYYCVGTKVLRDPMFRKDYFISSVNYIRNVENDDCKKKGKGKLTVSLKVGDNLFTALLNAGFDRNNVNEIVGLLISNLNLKNLLEGQTFIIDYSYDLLYKVRPVKNIVKKKYHKKNRHKAVLEIDTNNENTHCYPKIMDRVEDRYIEKIFFKLPNGIKYKVSRHNGSYILQIEKPKLITKRHVVSGIITTNLFSDVLVSNIKASTLYNVLNEYAFLIDFQRDLHVNDKFIFVLDTSTDEDGDVLSENILYVNLILSGKNYEIFNFNNRFYDRKGRSIERSLLKTPVDGARMSSKFNPKRKHPILGYTKAHLGVDLAVPSGTPIYASGDGVITRKTYNSAYGNYIEIRHNNEYSTRYAHMSKFANNLKVGQKIRQRQVIGYVGMTGLATGPHLHYEVLRHGRHINPSTVKATVRKTLNKQQLLTFEKNVKVINDILKDVSFKRR